MDGDEEASARTLHDVGPYEGYMEEAEEAQFPIGGYAGLVAGYQAFLAGAHKLATRNGRELPERISPGDFALLGLATFKLSRLITKDWVTIPLRAPFTKYEKTLTAGEVQETSRGKGMRKAVGDLLTCNYCIAPWVATGLVYGLATKPRATRLIAGAFSLVAVNDFLQFAYEGARARMEKATGSA